MKLLHVVASYAPAWRYGGPIQSVAALCQGLASHGEDVTVFTTNIDGPRDLPVPLGQPVLRDAVKVHYFQVQSPRRWSFSWPLTQALEQSTREFDLVHLHGVFVYPILAAAYFCRKYRIPYVISPRGMLDPIVLRMKPIRKRIYLNLLERRNLNGAAALHYTAPDEQRQAEGLRLPVLTVVVPNGLCLEQLAQLPSPGAFRSRHPEMARKRLILFLSRIHPKKGLDRLVQAFGRVAKRRPDVHLAIAGYDDEGYGQVVRRWLEDAGVAERVTFTGPLLGESKLAAFRDVDLFVLPSYQENFGMAVLEAMGCGLPVVVSNGVYLYREIQRAGAGLVVDGDPAGLAEAIEVLLRDATLRTRMGEAGRRLVRDRFSAEHVADQMRSVYQNILAGTTQARRGV
jgi:glycosyltransferase involved in cell wall biosynthesis